MLTGSQVDDLRLARARRQMSSLSKLRGVVMARVGSQGTVEAPQHEVDDIDIESKGAEAA